MKKAAYIFTVFTILFGCSSKSEKLDNTSIDKKSEVGNNESKIEQRIVDTDLNDSLKITNSLYFTKEDGSSFEVKAFLDKSDNVLKVEQKFMNGITNAYGTTLFYVQKGKKYASKERFEDRKEEKQTFVERISFYDKNEKVISTKIRKSFFEEDLDAQKYENVTLYDCSINQAMNAINQQGEFKTLFQGFVFNGRTNYITVGENGKNGYVSALLLQYENDVTRKLMKNQKDMIGKKLDLNFQKMIDNTGFEFQVLLSVAFAK